MTDLFTAPEVSPRKKRRPADFEDDDTVVTPKKLRT
jgi:hypothetical protein